MKKILLIAGGVVLLVVAGCAGLVAYRYFTQYRQVREMERQTVEAYQLYLQQQQAATNQAPQKLYKAVVRQGPQVADIHGYKTEDNWIAASISRETADMAFLIVCPGQPLPNFQVSAEVDPTQGRVRIDLAGWGTDRVVADLTPVFAWDGPGYAPFARQLLGMHAGVPLSAGTGSDDIVGRLLNLTGAEIAAEDVRVSGQIQRFPASWALHEQAALMLAALALRENAGPYQDNRLLLNRAAAHLALAKALRADQPETWPGLIAEAAVFTLSGREVDAVAALDTLAARPDCRDSAKVWITALRLAAKQDWRLADIQPTSPLLLKILWFQVVGHDLTDLAATRRLDPVISQDPSNPEALVPDWGRAIVAPDYKLSVENSQRFAQANMQPEFAELDAVLKAEGEPPADPKNLALTLSEPEARTVAADAQGKPVIHVIGTAAFKAATRRHLFNDVKPAEYGLDQGLGESAEAESFRSEMDILFRDVPLFDYVRLDTAGPIETFPTHQTYPVEQAPVGLISQWSYDDDFGLIKSFYTRPVPFGTAYQVENRSPLRDLFRGAEFMRHGGISSNDLLLKIFKLPLAEQNAAGNKLNDEVIAHPELYNPPALSSLDKAMLKLAPDQVALATQGQKVEVFKPHKYGEVEYLDHLELNSVVEPFLDYNLRYLQSLERWDISDADHEKLLRKEVLLNPDAYFELATILRVHGKEDEAAEMDRKGVAQAYDQVGMANSVLPLVLYDLDHGLKDEALSIAQRAADVYSYDGLQTEMVALERLGRLDEAEKIGHDIDDRYQDDHALNQFYLRNKARYPDQSERAIAAAFPNGMVKVALSDFSGRPHGAMFGHENGDMLRWDIHRGDVVVALNGYKVESIAQYDVVRAASFDPHMDFIIWKDQKKYVEVKAFVPTRRFGVDMYEFN